MFKIITLAILGYLFYRFFLQSPQISAPNDQPPIKDQPGEGDYIDYEEVDD
ncbi:MAG: hypothetical protein AAFP19_12820 [Bacteroidota bacterium]